MTVAIRHIDLSRAEPGGTSTASVFNIFWWGELPLGARMAHAEELPLGPGQTRALAIELLAEQLLARAPDLGAPLRAANEGRPRPALTLSAALHIDHLRARIDALAAPSTLSAADISVIVCTRDRGAALKICLTSLAAQRSPAGEIVVVDNSTNASARAICREFPGVVYVHEPRAGLSVARNTGIRTATRDKLVFTDDDVEVAPGWLAEFARAFEQSPAEAITGLVLPARLDTPAQRCFQFDMGGFGNQFVPVLFDQGFFAETRPRGAQVWKIGAGANMGFRRTAFARAGLFDERLGAGAAGCSEDSEFWYRLLALGGTCQYEPRIVVFHHHRADWVDLKRQMRVYMRGHVAALVAQADAFNDTGNLRRIAHQLPSYFVRTLLGSFINRRAERRAILFQEIRGWGAGLQYLLRPQWRKQRVPRGQP